MSDRELLFEYWKELAIGFLRQYGVLLVACIVIVWGGVWAIRFAMSKRIGGPESASGIIINVPADYTGTVRIFLDPQKGVAVPKTGPVSLSVVKGVVAVASFDRFCRADEQTGQPTNTAADLGFADEGGGAIPTGKFGDYPRAVWQLHFESSSYETFFVGSSKAYAAAFRHL